MRPFEQSVGVTPVANRFRLPARAFVWNHGRHKACPYGYCECGCGGDGFMTGGNLTNPGSPQSFFLVPMV